MLCGSSRLRVSSRRLLALGAGYGGRESGARDDRDSGASEHLADRPGPPSVQDTRRRLPFSGTRDLTQLPVLRSQFCDLG